MKETYTLHVSLILIKGRNDVVVVVENLVWVKCMLERGSILPSQITAAFLTEKSWQGLISRVQDQSSQKSQVNTQYSLASRRIRLWAGVTYCWRQVDLLHVLLLFRSILLVKMNRLRPQHWSSSRKMPWSEMNYILTYVDLNCIPYLTAYKHHFFSSKFKIKKGCGLCTDVSLYWNHCMFLYPKSSQISGATYARVFTVIKTLCTWQHSVDAHTTCIIIRTSH